MKYKDSKIPFSKRAPFIYLKVILRKIIKSSNLTIQLTIN